MEQLFAVLKLIDLLLQPHQYFHIVQILNLISLLIKNLNARLFLDFMHEIQNLAVSADNLISIFLAYLPDILFEGFIEDFLFDVAVLCRVF